MADLLKQNREGFPVRRFGRTEYAMPVYSCGGMRFNQSWTESDEISDENQRNVAACMERAFALGINHLETARGYGTSEKQIGIELSRFERDEIMLQTKVGCFEDVAEFKKQFEISFELLNTPYIDFLSLHGINDETTFNQAMRTGGCLDAARQFVKEGRVRHIGFSTHGWCENICRTINTGEFDYINMHWYFVNDLNRRALEDAQKQDMGVLILSPNDKGGKLYQPPQKLQGLVGELDPMVFNDLFCLAHPAVSTLSQGVSRPEEFDTHLRAIELYAERETVSAEITARLRAEMDAVLGAGWCQNWYRGIPEFYDLPGTVNVLEIVRLWAHAKALDMVDFAKMRYNLLGNGGHWFPGLKPAKFDRVAMAEKLQQSWLGAERICDIIEEAVTMLSGPSVQRQSKSGK